MTAPTLPLGHPAPPPAPGGRFTVIAVLRALGIAPHKSVTWPVGDVVRDAYRVRYGALPPKELRTKTCGAGGHCFATYPPHDWPWIVDLAWVTCAALQAEADAQPSLFDA